MAKPKYECVALPDVEPIFVEAMIIGAMAIRYCRQARIPIEDGYAAARATWESDMWDDDGPRTFERAIEMVDADLEHWDDQ